MKIGFYAPLKPPSHPKPSGDREIARLLIKALRAYNHDVEIVSQLRSWEGHGIKDRQNSIQRAAMKEVQRILDHYSTSGAPDLIFTYHVYHKAPDWIGLALASALNVPYVIAEASYAPKQLQGVWHCGHLQTRTCIQQASLIIALNPADIDCLIPLTSKNQKIEVLKPFLDEIPAVTAATTKLELHPGNDNSSIETVKLITVAMMREGDKKASYKLLSDTLKSLDLDMWKLVVIGDGNAADEIKKYFSDLNEKCTFTGKLDKQSIFRYLSASDLFIWPAINEAFGLALLEAQACGLPAVAQDYGGVSTIVENNLTGYVTCTDNNDEFTNAVKTLMTNKHKRRTMGMAARNKFISEHNFDVAANRLNALLVNIGRS